MKKSMKSGSRVGDGAGWGNNGGMTSDDLEQREFFPFLLKAEDDHALDAYGMAYLEENESDMINRLLSTEQRRSSVNKLLGGSDDVALQIGGGERKDGSQAQSQVNNDALLRLHANFDLNRAQQYNSSNAYDYRMRGIPINPETNKPLTKQDVHRAQLEL